jgi:hypothetical protein
MTYERSLLRNLNIYKIDLLYKIIIFLKIIIIIINFYRSLCGYEKE